MAPEEATVVAWGDQSRSDPGGHCPPRPAVRADAFAADGTVHGRVLRSTSTVASRRFPSTVHARRRQRSSCGPIRTVSTAAYRGVSRGLRLPTAVTRGPRPPARIEGNGNQVSHPIAAGNGGAWSPSAGRGRARDGGPGCWSSLRAPAGRRLTRQPNRYIGFCTSPGDACECHDVRQHRLRAMARPEGEPHELASPSGGSRSKMRGGRVLRPLSQ